jgi:hypothetical protein
MSDLIVLIRNETDTRRILKTLEDTTPRQTVRGSQVVPVGPLGPLVSPCCNVGSSLP